MRDKKWTRYENWKYISKKAIRNEIESKIIMEIKQEYNKWKQKTRFGTLYKKAKEKWTRKAKKRNARIKQNAYKENNGNKNRAYKITRMVI